MKLFFRHTTRGRWYQVALTILAVFFVGTSFAFAATFVGPTSPPTGNDRPGYTWNVNGLPSDTAQPNASLYVSGFVGASQFCLPDTNPANCISSWSDLVGTGGSNPWTLVTPSDPNNSDIYRFNGNVGIGTSAPQTRLDVVGPIRANDNPVISYRGSGATLPGGSNFISINAETSRGAITSYGELYARSIYGNIILDAPRVGIGTVSPTSKLDIQHAGGGMTTLINSNLNYGTGVTGSYAANQITAAYGASSSGSVTGLQITASTAGSGGVVGLRVNTPGTGASSRYGVVVNDGRVSVGTGVAGTNAELNIQSAGQNYWAVYHEYASGELRFWNDAAPLAGKNILSLSETGGATINGNTTINGTVGQDGLNVNSGNFRVNTGSVYLKCDPTKQTPQSLVGGECRPFYDGSWWILPGDGNGNGILVNTGNSRFFILRPTMGALLGIGGAGLGNSTLAINSYDFWYGNNCELSVGAGCAAQNQYGKTDVQITRGDLVVGTHQGSITNPGNIVLTGNITAEGTICDRNGCIGGGSGSSLWQLNGTNVYYNGGNVGIGTNAPAGKLHVSAGAIVLDNAVGRIQAKDTSGVVREVLYGRWSDNATYLDGGTGGLYLRTNNSAVTNMYLRNDGNVGVGTTNPGARLEVAGQVKITGGTPGVGKVLTSDATGLASWVTPATGSSFWQQSGTSIYYNSGNVGIGTAAPNKKLSVSGQIAVPQDNYIYLNGDTDNNWYIGKDSNHNIYINGFSSGSRAFQVRDSNAANAVRFNVDFGTGNSYFNGGNVGIGTTAPNKKLHIATPAGTNAEIDIQTGTLNHWGIYHDGVGEQLRFWNADAVSQPNVLVIANNGQVGIGTITPTSGFKLDVVNGTGPAIRGDGGTNPGIIGVTTGTNGAVRGIGNTGPGVWGETTGTLGAVRGIVTSGTGVGVYGNSSGVGVFGDGSGVNSTGVQGYGGVGVFGNALAHSAGVGIRGYGTTGVEGTTYNINGSGLLGNIDDTINTYNNNAIAVNANAGTYGKFAVKARSSQVGIFSRGNDVSLFATTIATDEDVNGTLDQVAAQDTSYAGYFRGNVAVNAGDVVVETGSLVLNNNGVILRDVVTGECRRLQLTNGALTTSAAFTCPTYD